MNEYGFELNAASINNFIVEKINQNNIEFIIFVLSDKSNGIGLPENVVHQIILGNYSIEDFEEQFVVVNKENNDVKKAIEEQKQLILKNSFSHDGDFFKFHKIEQREDIQINTHSSKIFEKKYREKLEVEEYLDDVIVLFDTKSDLVLSGTKILFNELNFIKFFNINIEDSKTFTQKNDPKVIFISKIKMKILDKIEKENVQMIDIKLSVRNKDFNFNIPRNLAYAYALSRYNRDYTTAISNWIPVSPTGLKMANDDPYHSDLWIFLDFPMDEASLYGFDSDHNEIFYRLGKAIHAHMTEREESFLFLSQPINGTFKGKIVTHNSEKITDKDVLVLPNANARYENLAKKAGVVIVEQGGQLSHIVLVSKEEMLPILLINDALSTYSENSLVEINFNQRSIIIH